MIKIVNAGDVPLRVRRRSADKLKGALDDARATVLTRIKSAGTLTTARYKLQTIARYKELHKNRHPKEDGWIVVKKNSTVLCKRWS